MADNLDLAIRIRADLQSALNNLGKMEGRQQGRPGDETVQRRSVGFMLIVERLGDSLTPVTFYRVKR